MHADGRGLVALQSMTGFARVEGGDESFAWTWEARSVNGKGLDLRCRLPQGYDELDVVAREAAARRMSRGNLNLTLSLRREQAASGFRLNQEAFVQAAALARELADLPGIAPPSLDGLLRLPGVVDSGGGAEGMDPAHRDALVASLNQVLDALAAQRAAEGACLVEILGRLLDEIEALVARATACDDARPAQIRDRLMRQVAELTEGRTPVSEERLAQEIAMLVTRADVREEIDRLTAHVTATRELLAGDAPGRRLGFLSQELLREANTLCSKSQAQQLTAIGLDLKVAIDRLREQALNVE